MTKKNSRSFLLIFIVSSAILLFLGHIFFNLQKEEITNKIYSELQTISLLKEKQIKDWYKERLEIADFIRNDQLLISDLKVFFDNKDKSAGRIIEWLSALRKDSNFTEAMFFDSEFKERFSPEFFHPIGAPGLKAMEEAAKSRKIVVSDFHRSETDTHAHLDITIPLSNAKTVNSPLVGILFIRIDPNTFLFPLIQNWEGHSKSGETMLVKRDGDSVVYLNTLRHVKNIPLEMKSSIKDTSHTSARLVLGKEGFFEGKDYRGVQVLSYLNKIEGTNWLMVTKEDTEEIYAPLRFRAFITGIIVVLLIVIVAVILILIWKNEQKKFYQVKYELEAEKKLLTKHVELLIKHANDMIFMIDSDRRIVDVNDKVLETYGYSREEIINMRADDFRSRESAPATRDSFVRAEVEGGIVHETMHQRKDGTTFPVEVSTRCIEIDGKKFFQGIVRDISERKTKDIKIQRLNRVYATLSDINQLIVREHNREVILAKSCSIAVEKGGFLLSWVGILDKTSGWIKVASSFGKIKEYLNQIEISIDPDLPEGQGPTGTALREKRFDICNDIEHEARMSPWRNNQLKYGIRSSAAFPLIVHGETFGVFTVYSEELGFFDKEEIALLDELSKDISFALEHIEEEEKRRVAEVALKRSEERYRTLAEAANEIIFVLSTDREIEYVNNYGAQLFSRTPKEVIGHNVNLFFRNSAFQKQEESLRKVFETGTPLYEESKLKFGNREIWLGTSLVPLRNEEGKIVSIMGVSRDITQRRLADEQIRKLSRGIEQSPATIIITDTNGKIEYVNPKFTETTGYSFEEAVGNNPRILKSGEKSPEEYKHLWNTIKSGKEWRGEFHNKKKNGELYWEQASISPIKDAEGNVTHFIAVKEDITAIKKLIEQLFEAKDKAEIANKLKSEFLAQMSHEIRSPINITMNFSSLLKDAIGDYMTPDMQEYFDGIQTAGKRLIRTIGLILNASEIQVGTYEPTWTNIDLMKDIFEPIKTEYGATAKMQGLNFSIINHAAKPIVSGDKYSLNQVFVNLVDNAIKYTREGEVDVTIDRNADQFIQVIIKDTGIGMSEEFMSNMFEPFMQEERGYSRRFEGNGLGLSLVKKYCELNTASIEVKSEKGKGSTFTVTFRKETTIG